MLREMLGRLDAAVQRSGWPGNIDLIQNVARVLTAVYGAKALGEMARELAGPTPSPEVVTQLAVAAMVGTVDHLLDEIVELASGPRRTDLRDYALDWLKARVMQLFGEEGVVFPTPPPRPLVEHGQAVEVPSMTSWRPARPKADDVVDAELADDDDPDEDLPGDDELVADVIRLRELTGRAPR
jgi:hypothetical protein